MPLKREKAFGLGPAIPADRNEKCRVVARAHAYNATHKQPGQHIGPITRTMLTVLVVILWDFHNSRTGHCFPSHKTIAAASDCSRDTVIEATKMFECAKLLTWAHRLVRVDGPHRDLFGVPISRLLRTSNAYVLTVRQRVPDFPTRTQQLYISIGSPRNEAVDKWAKRPEPVAPERTVKEQLAALGYRLDDASGRLIPLA